jgi:hypothetical protein
MRTNDDPYYYGNSDCPPTILEFKSHDAPISHIEMPWDASTNDVLTALYGAMIVSGFHPIDILETMKQFAEDGISSIK